MSTFTPRAPYTQDELDRLYPRGLKLQLVQVLLRHGERSPVSARFRNAGLPAYWPYCNAARKLSSVSMSNSDWPTWDYLQWRRRIETFSQDDSPLIATGPGGELDGICQLGELTDTGRKTTLALGQRLRNLYVDQLGFMPNLIADADMIYLRATPMPRALESVQQTFWGLYPLASRTASFPPPTIVTRTATEETLFPNESNCRRFSQLSRAFAQRTADRWNRSKEMDYINRMVGKWMPEDSPRVAVDSHPRLSGVMDTINSTWAHGQPTRLPKEFYDPKSRKLIESIGVEEWFSGYEESAEYRTVGVGALVGDVVERMVGSIQRKNGGNGQDIKLALSGCHDTTLAAILSSFGCFKGEGWPPYTSHIALELFRKDDIPQRQAQVGDSNSSTTSGKNGILSSLFGGAQNAATQKPIATATPRKPIDQLNAVERKSLDGYYVRIRYNDKPVTVPGCKAPGKHLDGDESFCTLEAFKEIADKFTPKNWKKACNENLDQPVFPRQVEVSGY